MARVIDQVLGATTSSVVGEITRELANASDGAGLHFDGAAGSVSFTPVDLGTQFSFEFVVKADELDGGSSKDYLVMYGSGGTFIVGHNDGNLSVFSTGGTEWQSFGANPLSDLKVHHIVVTVDDTSATLYDNGNQIGTATIASPDIDSATAARLLSNDAGTSGHFAATLYRARSYNKALESDEVRTAFERADVDFSSQYGSQTELVTNGDFASATGWSKGDVTVVGDGTAVWAASGDYQYLRRSDWSITKGKKYRITVVTSAHTTNGTLNVMGYTGSPSIATTNLDGDAFTISGTGTHIFEFEALADSSGGVLFGSYPTGAAYVGTMTDISCVQIGAVSDYDLAYAQPALSTLIQDRSNAADGVASSTGVAQVQPITQLNSTSARIGSTQLAAGTAPYIPADGELLASGNIGSGSADPNINGWGNAITIDNSDTAALEFAKSGTLYGFVGVQGSGSGNAFDVAAYQSQDMRFRVGSNAGTTAITIDSTGNIRIGSQTSNIDNLLKLDVANGNDVFLGIRQADQIQWHIGQKASDTSLYFRSGNVGSETDHLTIDSTGKIGQNCDPEAFMHIQAADASVAPAGTADVAAFEFTAGAGIDGISLLYPDAKTGQIVFGTPSDNDAGRIVYGGPSVTTAADQDAMRFHTAGTEAMRIDSTGLATFSNGIAFSAPNPASAGTPAASSVLDVYEEGTWTPVFSAGSNASGTWDTTLEGEYTRIGNLVTVSMRITGGGMDFSNAIGYRTYSGLPFAGTLKGAGAVSTAHAASFSGTTSTNVGTNMTIIPSETGSGTSEVLAQATYRV